MPSLKFVYKFLRRIKKLRTNKSCLNISLVLLISFLVAILFKLQFIQLILGQIALPDFDIYYQTARDVIAGAHPYQLSYMQTNGPPLVIAPFLLLAWMPLSTARSAITLLSLGCALGSSYLLAKFITKKYIYLITILLFIILLLTFPARFSLLMGQPNFMVMLAVTVLMTNQKTKISGLAASLIIILKTQFLLTWLALIKNHKQILFVALVVTGLIGMITLPILKPQYYFDYLRERGGFYVSTAVSTQPTTDYYNQSLRSTMNRLGIGQWYVYFWAPLLVTVSLYLIRTGNVQLGVIAPFLLSPIIWQHYYVALFPLLITLLWQNRRRPKLAGLLFIIGLLLFSQFSQLHEWKLNFISGLIASHYFWGSLLLAVFIIWDEAKARRKTAKYSGPTLSKV